MNLRTVSFIIGLLAAQGALGQVSVEIGTGTSLEAHEEERKPLFDKRDVKEFADAMVNAGIMPREQRAGFVKAAGTDSIDESVDIMAFLKGGVVIDAQRLSDDPREYYPAIFQQLKSLAPEVDYDSVVVEPFVAMRGPDYSVEAIEVSFVVDGVRYYQEVFYNSDWGNREYLGKLGDAIHTLFNKVLADKGVEDRIHLLQNSIQWREMIARSWTKQGYIRLTGEQRAVMEGYSTYLDIATGLFDRSIGPRGIEGIIGEYRTIGMLDHLTPEQIAEVTRVAQRRVIQSVDDILKIVPRLTWGPLHDELQDGGYREVIEELAAISRGRFQPSDIVDDFDRTSGNDSRVEFTLAGKRYAEMMRYEDGYIDDSLYAFVERALKESGVDGRFYYMGSRGVGAYIFLTDAQYVYVKSEELVNFAE